MKTRKGSAKKKAAGEHVAVARERGPRYRKIQVRMHSDWKFMALSDPQPCGKYLWLYLLSGPHTGIIPGVSVAGEAQLAEALKWSLEGFRESFRECTEKELVQVDWSARVLYVPNALRHNPPQNPNVVKGWRDAWEEVPECELKSLIFLRILAFLRELGEEYAKAFESFGKSFPESFPESLRKSGSGTGSGTGVLEVLPTVALLRGRGGTKGKEGPPAPEADDGEAIEGLFAVHIAEHRLCHDLRGEEPTEPRLTEARRELLAGVLRIYPIEEVEGAFRGAKFSDWHMGEVDGQAKLGIEQVLATKGRKNHLEELANLARNPPRWARERWRGDPRVFPEPVPVDHIERIERILAVCPRVNGFRPQIEALKEVGNRTLVVRELEAFSDTLRREAIEALDREEVEARADPQTDAGHAYVIAAREASSEVPPLVDLYQQPRTLALWEEAARRGCSVAAIIEEQVRREVCGNP